MSKRLQITLTDDVYVKLNIICECLHNLPKSTAIDVAVDSLYAFYLRKGDIERDAFYKEKKRQSLEDFYKENALEPEQAWIE